MKLVLVILLIFLLSGCTVINEEEYGRHVKGIGIDMTFYPVFSIKTGVFEYWLFFD